MWTGRKIRVGERDSEGKGGANGRGKREGRKLKGRRETGKVGKREEEGRLRAGPGKGGKARRQEGRWTE